MNNSPQIQNVHSQYIVVLHANQTVSQFVHFLQEYKQYKFTFPYPLMVDVRDLSVLACNLPSTLSRLTKHPSNHPHFSPLKLFSNIPVYIHIGFYFPY